MVEREESYFYHGVHFWTLCIQASLLYTYTYPHKEQKKIGLQPKQKRPKKKKRFEEEPKDDQKNLRIIQHRPPTAPLGPPRPKAKNVKKKRCWMNLAV